MVAGLLIVGMIVAMAEGEKPAQVETATFAGGCFWCMEPPFEKLEGVQSVRAGYTGGTVKDPTYEQVSSGTTGHAEAIEVLYDPSKVSYEQLLDIFWMNIDPTTPNQQFSDHGSQYRSAIFTHTEEQKRLAEGSKDTLARSGTFTAPLVTEIVPASTFYPAEEHHQDYYKKHALRYNLYRVGSGRAGFLKKTWGKSAH
jgi:methionine-S-sulfoxide reductase